MSKTPPTGGAIKQKPKLVALAGPTGVGKTDAAVKLAEAHGAEIINADSMQVYRYMDVGTAKPSAEERARAEHHLLDIVNPDQDFDAASFLKLARPKIDQLWKQGAPMLVVGGTGFYIRSLLMGLVDMPGSDAAIRARLKEEAHKKGNDHLHQKLVQADPAAAGRIHKNDTFRVIRALEVFELTGKPISFFQQEHGLSEKPYEVLFIGLNLPRDELKTRIALRTDRMFEQGLTEEVKWLLDQGYSRELKPLQAIGYKQVVALLDGKMSRDQAKAEIVKHTARYAKRQLTWLRAQKDLVWSEALIEPQLMDKVARFWGA